MSLPPTSARIINHSHGQGTTTVDDVRQRAIELAVIAGRNGMDFTDEDWQQARYELQGGHGNFENDLEMEMEAGLGSGGVAGSIGHHVPNHSVDQSEHAAEELILEGLEEAEHEQMLAASRHDREDEI